MTLVGARKEGNIGSGLRPVRDETREMVVGKWCKPGFLSSERTGVSPFLSISPQFIQR